MARALLIVSLGFMLVASSFAQFGNPQTQPPPPAGGPAPANSPPQNAFGNTQAPPASGSNGNNTPPPPPPPFPSNNNAGPPKTEPEPAANPAGGSTIVPIITGSNNTNLHNVSVTTPSSSKHTGHEHNGATNTVAVASSLLLVCLAPVLF